MIDRAGPPNQGRAMHNDRPSDKVATKLPALAAILLLGMGLRVALFLCAWHESPDLERMHQPDSITYVEPAENLLTTGASTCSAVANCFARRVIPCF